MINERNYMNPFKQEAVASDYDAFYANRIGKLIDKLEQDTVSALINKKPISSLLEIGSGTGHWSAYYASRGYSVVGIEVSLPMLNIAENKEIPKTRFIHADAHDFLLDEKVDAVAFMTSLEFIERPRQAIANAINYLNPGGVLLFGVLNRTSWLGEGQAQDPVYSKAHFYEEQEILDIFGPRREKTVRQCVFTPPPVMMGQTDDEVLAAEARSLEQNLKSGAFIAGRVDI